jgi:hypothetical protein
MTGPSSAGMENTGGFASVAVSRGVQVAVGVRVGPRVRVTVGVRVG